MKYVSPSYRSNIDLIQIIIRLPLDSTRMPENDIKILYGPNKQKSGRNVKNKDDWAEGLEPGEGWIFYSEWED